MKKNDTALRLTKRFFEDLREFSPGVAFGRLIRDIPLLSWDRRRSFYERQILRYLDRRYGGIIEQCASTAPVLSQHSESTEKRIWVMWWQGEGNMPPIVRACWDRLKKVAPCEPVLLTEETIPEWITLPEYILNKHRMGCITTTHLSDIVRALLLKKYGGLWMDATIWADHIPENIWLEELYTLHAPGMFPEFISRGDWSPFLLYSRMPNHKLLNALYGVFTAYWSEHMCLIDYLFVDFTIRLIIDHCQDIKRAIDSLQINNAYYELNLAINEPYSLIKTEEMLSCSALQKLTYKKQLNEITDDGKLTNYGFLLQRDN